MAPPHTRGWTLLPHQRERDGEGSPAHAGMDPRVRGSPTTPPRLPRTRGDGPVDTDLLVYRPPLAVVRSERIQVVVYGVRVSPR